jgi:choline dehydrogenase
VGSFDYVVVGAGGSGAVLAARLTENPSTTVLVLEAGPDIRWADSPPDMLSMHPVKLILGDEHRRFRWPELRARRTAAQEPTPFWRGRALGGGTAINGMFAVRPSPGDFDEWAADGSPGWAWADVLPWFCHLEDDADFGDRPYHGQGGPYPVWRPPQDGWGRVDAAVRDAAMRFGHPWCADHNAPEGTGVSPYAASVRDGRRASTFDAYLEPARGRANLTVIGDALVDRVIFDRDRAVAVEYLSEGGRRERIEGGEVILSAGAVHSPAILQRSGVGPPDLLHGVGVDVVSALPGVGGNLSDHPTVMITMISEPDDSWLAPNGRHGSCFVRWSTGEAGSGENDMGLFSQALSSPFGAGSLGLAGPSVWQPFSRGELRITTSDPTVDPVIDENMLSDPRDLKRMRAALRHLLELLASPAFSFAGATRLVVGPDLSADRLPDQLSDAELDELALCKASDLQHIVGTCRMGDPADGTTVVDPSGRVVGLEALRVVDASIVPACPRANTALTAIMLAEKLAAEIAS